MKTLILILAALAFTTGCGPSTKKPITARTDPYKSHQIHYTDGELRDRTRLGDVKVDRNEHGILLITVPIRAAIDKTFSIDWRITFFDRNGRPISNTGWAAKTLNANTYEYITANSLSAEADEFQIDFRYSE